MSSKKRKKAPPSKAPGPTSGGSTRTTSAKSAPSQAAGASPSTSTSNQSQTNRNNTSSTTGLLEYLQSHLSRPDLLALYQDNGRGKYVCRAVLQQRVSAEMQQVIVRLACGGGTFPLKLAQVWIKESTMEQQKTNQPPNRFASQLQTLQDWAILMPTTNDDEQSIALTAEFHKGLKDSLHSLDVSPWIALTEDDKDLLQAQAQAAAPAAPGSSTSDIRFPHMSTDELEVYTQSQWDNVLHYLVGTPMDKRQGGSGSAALNPAITHFLLQTNLMQPDPEYTTSGKKEDEDNAPLVITQKGYDFMLQDNAQQVWHFVAQYLKRLDESNRDSLKREALLVLVSLSFATFGDCYSATTLSKDGRVILRDMAHFGLLYVKKIGKTSVFYPTRLAMQLVGNNSNSSTSAGVWSWSAKALESALSHPTPKESSHLAIIVQTNFQLCAYTTSELHVSMLGLFCDVQTIRRLPNAVFMTITRDSIKAAFHLGIQATQILRFLEKHAHPKLRQSTASSSSTSRSPLPPNIVDQIFLWDRERHRLQWKEVYLHQCVLQGEFDAMRQFAIQRHAHGWSDRGRNQLYLHYDQAEDLQRFIKSFNNGMG